MWLPGGVRIYTEMATAIVRVYNPDGFVIAADGRKMNTHRDRSIVSDDTQKVFKIEGPETLAAYAMAGIIELSTDDESDDIVFDLRSEIATAVEYLSSRRTTNLLGYATRLSRIVNRQLADAKRSGKIRRYPVRPSAIPELGNTIARLYLDGYHNHIPLRVDVRFFHKDQELSNPEILPQGLYPGRPITFGSVLIADQLFGGKDDRLARFHKHWTSTLKGGIDMCHDYLAACSSPEGLELDDGCSGVGGRIHIATITPQGGFNWVKGFEPVEKRPA
jgi:hypothetical protein